MITDTEEHILEVAKKVFLKKGLAGTRLQEIADEAGIGRTALHYYFRNKEKLFQVVWTKVFEQVASRTNLVYDSNSSIIEKMKQFTNGYYESALLFPEYDLFFLNEFNQNPDIMKEIFSSGLSLNPSNNLLSEIERAIKNGELKGDAMNIFITLLSINIYPFAAKSMFQVLLDIDDNEFIKHMERRKKFVNLFIDQFFIFQLNPEKK